MNAIGILNLHDNPTLEKLTEPRPLASVVFLGRYGIMDFALSNFSNSEINKVEILVERNIDSVRGHIQNGAPWINNTRTGFVRAVINESVMGTSKANTDIGNITFNIPDTAFNEDYVVIVPPHFLYTLDFRNVLAKHIATGADITVVTKRTDEADKEFIGCSQVVIDSDGTIRRFSDNLGENKDADISLEAYVMSKEVFFALLKFSNEISNTTATIKKMIEIYAHNRMRKVMAYRFDGYVAPILSLNDYIRYSFKLLENKYRKQLFNEEWPIYTPTHNTPPALYGPNADVSNSIISNGCIIKGKVKNCILARGVRINEGAVVEDCIMLTDTRVGDGVHVQYIVTDKIVKIKVVKNLAGDEEDFLLIAKGAEI